MPEVLPAYKARTTAQKQGAICLKGCGKYTVGPTGICAPCRTTTCLRCGKLLRQLYDGQRVHSHCTARKLQ